MFNCQLETAFNLSYSVQLVVSTILWKASCVHLTRCTYLADIALWDALSSVVHVKKTNGRSRKHQKTFGKNRLHNRPICRFSDYMKYLHTVQLVPNTEVLMYGRCDSHLLKLLFLAVLSCSKSNHSVLVSWQGTCHGIWLHFGVLEAWQCAEFSANCTFWTAFWAYYDLVGRLVDCRFVFLLYWQICYRISRFRKCHILSALRHSKKMKERIWAIKGRRW
jgi:hypothetical protein